MRDDFEPNPVPVWLTTDVVEQVARAVEDGTIVWCRWGAVGNALHQLGITYYPGGTNPMDQPDGEPLVIGTASKRLVGLNMQKWNRNLVLTPPANPDSWEQLIGRTHRSGQKADTVYTQVIDAIPYHREVMHRVTAKARVDSTASGFTQKLVEATWA